MNKLYLFLTVLSCCLWTACTNPNGDLMEEDPATNIIVIDGHDFVVRGDIDGEEFVIKHESSVQRNWPENTPIFLRPTFGTHFMLRYGGLYPERNIHFGITRDENSLFDDVVRVGRYGWRDDSQPNQFEGEAMINQLIFGSDNMTSTVHPELNPENYFEITAITPLELDKNLDDLYEGKLYKVEGHFAIDLDKWDNSDHIPRLTIDYFSAIFYDDSE